MHGSLKIVILIIILSIGIVVRKQGLLEPDLILDFLEDITESWWLPPAAVLFQAFMYAMAFPASILMWAIGAIYPPLTATILVVAGGVMGSLSAYFLSSRMTSSWSTKLQRSKVFKTIKNNSGFLQLCALRCLPGFPHALINYSAGILKVRLVPFIVSSCIGFALKGFIYCSAIYSALHIEDEPVINLTTLWPLIALVIFALLGVAIQKKYFSD
ncbi:MAG: DedA family protein [Desulfonatronovibrio sp. MSAO_Bac4]|nr:MAG: DedA family protein [Desulfonatronovibrio sp. MSAO_Bac4]